MPGKTRGPVDRRPQPRRATRRATSDRRDFMTRMVALGLAAPLYAGTARPASASPTSVLRLYHYPLWPDAQAARICLLEQREDHHLLTVDMASGQHRSPAFRALNPEGEPPVLEDPVGPFGSGLLRVWEVLAIANYLDWRQRATTGGGPTLFPSDPGVLPPTNQWAAWSQVHLTPALERLLLSGLILPPADRDPRDMRPALRAFRRSLQILNWHLAQGHVFVNGTSRYPTGTFSFADITIGATLTLARLIPEAELRLDQFPAVVAYLERLEARSSFLSAFGGITLPPPPSDLLVFPA